MIKRNYYLLVPWSVRDCTNIIGVVGRVEPYLSLGKKKKAVFLMLARRLIVYPTLYLIILMELLMCTTTLISPWYRDRPSVLCICQSPPLWTMAQIKVVLFLFNLPILYNFSLQYNLDKYILHNSSQNHSFTKSFVKNYFTKHPQFMILTCYK